ncbi:MAG: hypothetical protein KAI25_09515 [Hyphomicrobiaceae bacterium]|nr:hypothetical protein [Hyphomicrobiaceae bacterium]
MCPLLNQEDAECQVYMNLAHLEEAIGLCGNDFRECPIYQQKTGQRKYAVARPA